MADLPTLKFLYNSSRLIASKSRAPFHKICGTKSSTRVSQQSRFISDKIGKPASPAPPVHEVIHPPRQREAVEGYPLSVLPHGMLARSLLVSTISSHRWLLLPSLSFLSFLAKPDRGFLFNVERNPVLHKILRWAFYDQFCAGETAKETMACAQRFKQLGFKGVIMTYAKETVFNHHTQTASGHTSQPSASLSEAEPNQDIEDWKTGCLLTAGTIGVGDYLAIKFTGAGPTVTSAFAANKDPPQQMKDAAEEIASHCEKRGLKLIIDAESQIYQRAIDRMSIDLMQKHNQNGYATVYNTYQAYLKRTPDNIAQHLRKANESGFTLGLKLVRGAYILSDNRKEIHDTKEDTDNAYNSISRRVLSQEFGRFSANGNGPDRFPSVNLLLCTHNRHSVIAAQKLHREQYSNGLPTVPIVFGQLQGMSDEVSFSLLQNKEWYNTGSDVLKCSTWGPLRDCLAYLVRRAVENRDAVLRTSDEHRAVKAECWRRLKSMISL